MKNAFNRVVSYYVEENVFIETTQCVKELN